MPHTYSPHVLRNEDLLGTYPSGSAKDNTSKRGERSVGFWQGKEGRRRARERP